MFFKMGGVKELIGFRALTNEELRPGETPSVRDTEAYLRFRRIWGPSADEKFARYSTAPMLKPNESANRRIQNFLEGERRHPKRPLVIVCPYSNYPSKDIPDETLIEFLPSLEEKGNVETLLLGGKKDFARAKSVLDKAGVGLNGCGAFSLEESASLLKFSKLAICTDSGPMHLASALGVPCLITFSRINKQLYRWFPFQQKHTVLYRELACAGCKLINCAVEGHPCMRRITAGQILTAALNNLNGNLVSLGAFGDTRVACW
jgi:ADP-heptose:LPS heptosyltransferase